MVQYSNYVMLTCGSTNTHQCYMDSDMRLGEITQKVAGHYKLWNLPFI